MGEGKQALSVRIQAQHRLGDHSKSACCLRNRLLCAFWPVENVRASQEVVLFPVQFSIAASSGDFSLVHGGRPGAFLSVSSQSLGSQLFHRGS